jgi:transcriptional regulator with XRE-family HTH domain
MQNEHPLDQLFATAKQHGVPMAHVCERAGIDATTPSRWKRGLTRPTADKLFELGNALTEIIAERTPEHSTPTQEAAA